MRQASEVMAVPHSTLKNKYTDLAVVLVGPIQFVAYAALVSDSLVRRSQTGLTRIVIWRHGAQSVTNMHMDSYEASGT